MKLTSLLDLHAMIEEGGRVYSAGIVERFSIGVPAIVAMITHWTDCDATAYGTIRVVTAYTTRAWADTAPNVFNAFSHTTATFVECQCTAVPCLNAVTDKAAN